MKLWLVLDYEGWGHCHNVVRAESIDEAVRLAGGSPLPFKSCMSEVKELPLEGPPAVLWCDEESPDSVRED